MQTASRHCEENFRTTLPAACLEGELAMLTPIDRAQASAKETDQRNRLGVAIASALAAQPEGI
jgi:hypothetical protein